MTAAQPSDPSLWDVVVVPYDPAWPRMFGSLAAEIRAACPGATIEHVGSTAVPGMMAKPIIDVEVLTSTFARELAARYPHDGSSYTGGKTGFIRRVGRLVAGLGPETISVEPYDPAWPVRFEAEAARILSATNNQLIAIEHIGSTSVPGLPAKPIIDMMGLVPSFDAGRHLVVPIRSLGYLYYGENEIPRRHYFDLEDENGRDVVHLHVLEEGSADARNHVLFRDYLRAHKDARDAYAALKYELIAKYAHDRRTYTDQKADFIGTILAAASTVGCRD